MEIEAKPGKGGQGSWLMPECVCVWGGAHVFICGHACVCMTVPSHFYHSTWESKGPSEFPCCFMLEEGAAVIWWRTFSFSRIPCGGHISEAVFTVFGNDFVRVLVPRLGVIWGFHPSRFTCVFQR